MMDFRKVYIAKQKAYDLLRDWIKLVARHTNPDQEISELLGWLWKLKPANPDPITGLVPCGCGGVARVAVQYAYPDERRVFCERCGLTTIWLSAPMSVLQFHWNRAMGMLEVEG